MVSAFIATCLDSVVYEGRLEELKNTGKVMKVNYGDARQDRCACALLAQ